MAGPEIKAVMVGKWTVGLDRGNGMAIIQFEFTDREPLVFAMDVKSAEEFGAKLTTLEVDASKQRH